MSTMVARQTAGRSSLWKRLVAQLLFGRLIAALSQDSCYSTSPNEPVRRPRPRRYSYMEPFKGPAPTCRIQPDPCAALARHFERQGR
jgi:hypothetical protein